MHAKWFAQGVTFLCRMIDLVTTVRSSAPKSVTIRLNSEFRADLAWWAISINGTAPPSSHHPCTSPDWRSRRMPLVPGVAGHGMVQHGSRYSGTKEHSLSPLPRKNLSLYHCSLCDMGNHGKENT